MKNRVDIVIDGEKLDLFDDEQIVLNVAAKDARQPAEIFLDYSQDITVPASPKNNRLLKNYGKVFDTRAYNTSKYIENVELRLNGETFRTGNLDLLNLIESVNGSKSYLINFIDSSYTLIERFSTINIGLWEETDGDSSRPRSQKNIFQNTNSVSNDFTTAYYNEMFNISNEIMVRQDVDEIGTRASYGYTGSVIFAPVYSKRSYTNYYNLIENPGNPITVQNTSGAFFDGSTHHIAAGQTAGGQYDDGSYGGLDINELKPLVNVSKIIEMIENAGTSKGDADIIFSFGNSYTELVDTFSQSYIYCDRTNDNLSEENIISTNYGNEFIEGDYVLNFDTDLRKFKPILDVQNIADHFGTYSVGEGKYYCNQPGATDITGTVTVRPQRDAGGVIKVYYVFNGLPPAPSLTTTGTYSGGDSSLELVTPNTFNMIIGDELEIFIEDLPLTTATGSEIESEWKSQRLLIEEVDLRIPETFTYSFPTNVLMNYSETDFRPRTTIINSFFELPRVSIKDFLKTIARIGNYYVVKNPYNNVFEFKKNNSLTKLLNGQSVNILNLDKYVDNNEITYTDINNYKDINITYNKNIFEDLNYNKTIIKKDASEVTEEDYNYELPVWFGGYSAEKLSGLNAQNKIVEYVSLANPNNSSNTLRVLYSNYVLGRSVQTLGIPAYKLNTTNLISYSNIIGASEYNPDVELDYEPIGGDGLFILNKRKSGSFDPLSTLSSNVGFKNKSFGTKFSRAEYDTIVGDIDFYPIGLTFSNGFTYRYDKVNYFQPLTTPDKFLTNTNFSNSFVFSDKLNEISDYVNAFYGTNSRIIKIKAIIPPHISRNITTDSVVSIRNIKYLVNKATINLTTNEVNLELLVIR